MTLVRAWQDGELVRTASAFSSAERTREVERFILCDGFQLGEARPASSGGDFWHEVIIGRLDALSRKDGWKVSAEDA
jgi:hypothetical protein